MTNYDENLYKIVENMYAAEKNDSIKSYRKGFKK